MRDDSFHYADLPMRGGRFMPDEVHWAMAGWSKMAPGFGGWRVVAHFGEDATGDALMHDEIWVIPPSPLSDAMAGPRFVAAATLDGRTILYGEDQRGMRRELAVFSSLSAALHMLCPLTPAQETNADMLAARALSGLCY
jgi:hypothetical protein